MENQLAELVVEVRNMGQSNAISAIAFQKDFHGGRGLNEVVQDKLLRITIVGARGLLGTDSLPGGRKSDVYCVCEIQGKPDAPKVQTKAVKNTCDPMWDHEAEVMEFAVGDTLAFHVYDQGVDKQDDYLGTLTVTSEQFYPVGFEGELPLSDVGRGIQAFLMLKIVPLAAAMIQDVGTSQHATSETATEFGREPWDDIAALRNDLDGLHEVVETLASQVSPGQAQAGLDMQVLAKALEEESARRYEAIAELQAYVQQEMGEVSNHIDQLWHGIKAASIESQAAGAGLEADSPSMLDLLPGLEALSAAGSGVH